jgi:hypothetical protein
MNEIADQPVNPSLWEIFYEFLLIGAISFGGGIVAYQKILLTEKRHWLNDDEFMACLAISQTMPGLNAVNIAVLTGDKLRGVLGAIVAAVGLLIPGICFCPGDGYPLFGQLESASGKYGAGLRWSGGHGITFRHHLPSWQKAIQPFQIPTGRDCVLLFDEHFKLILGHGAAHHGPHRPHPFPSKELSTWFQHLFISP